MSQFLRSVRQGRWYKYPDVEWLEAGEIQADALSDIQTKDGRLSVYRVANDYDIQRVAALAANRDKITNIDYVVFTGANLDSLGITVRPTEGKTPDGAINRLHCELGNLTAKRLVQLAGVVSAETHKRIQKRQIKERLQEAASAGHLDKARVASQKVRDGLLW